MSELINKQSVIDNIESTMRLDEALPDVDYKYLFGVLKAQIERGDFDADDGWNWSDDNGVYRELPDGGDKVQVAFIHNVTYRPNINHGIIEPIFIHDGGMDNVIGWRHITKNQDKT